MRSNKNRLSNKEIKNILIIRFSSLGDVVLTTPVIEAVRQKFPQANLYYLTKKTYRGLLAANPFIRKIFCVDTYDGLAGVIDLSRAVKNIRRLQIDLVLNLHFPGWSYKRLTFLNFFILRLIRAKKRITFSRPSFPNLSRSKEKQKHVLDFYTEELEKEKICLVNRQPRLFLDKQDKEWAAQFLVSKNVSEKTMLIGVCPGASYPSKQWEGRNFQEVCRRLSLDPQARFLFFEQRQRSSLIEQICRDFDPAKTLRAVGFSLEKVVALLGQCQLVLSNDSGLMHVASAVNTPTVAFFGPTHPKLGFYPLGDKNVILCANHFCSPCSRWGEKKCKYNNRVCLEKIKVETVLAHCFRLLQLKQQPGKEMAFSEK